MALYTQLDDSAIRQIAKQYPIGNIRKWDLLIGGSANTNHLIYTATGKYVLTLCERKSYTESTNLTSILKYLETQGFTTSKVVLTNQGKTLSSFLKKPIILKEFIEGEITENFGIELLKKVGKSIAQLNQIPSPKGLPTEFSYGQQLFKDFYLSPPSHPFKDWLAKMHQYMLKNLSPDLPKAFIHGDIFASNVVISDNNTPIIMDFEEACYYYRIFDLGMAVTGLCRAVGQLDWAKVRALVDGYETITPLLSIEKEKLNLFIIYAATATAFWRFRQFNILVPTADLKDHYKKMQQIADSVHSS